jgi:hypothetical protein
MSSAVSARKTNMRNINRAKIAFEDLYPDATVRVDSHVVNLSQDGGHNASVVTCYGFRGDFSDGRFVVCPEWCTDDYFSEISMDEMRSYFEERCLVHPARLV